MSAIIVSFRGRSVGRRARLEQQIARITALLEELEGIGANDVPLALVARAQADLRRARDVLRPAQPGLEPQPEVDREAVERMYRSLEPER